MMTFPRPPASRFPVLALAAALLVAGCSGGGEDAASDEAPEAVQEVTAPTPAPEPVAPASPRPAETPETTNLAAPAEEEPSADERMLEDASATGMTARAERGEEPAPAEEGAQARDEAREE